VANPQRYARYALRWHKSLKTECIRPKTPLCLEDARRLTGEFVMHYNETRLHSAIGFVTPLDTPVRIL